MVLISIGNPPLAIFVDGHIFEVASSQKVETAASNTVLSTVHIWLNSSYKIWQNLVEIQLTKEFAQCLICATVQIGYIMSQWPDQKYCLF